MLCNGLLRSVSLLAGHLGKHTEARRLSYICGGSKTARCLTYYLRNYQLERTRNMMVDCSSTARGSMVDVLPEKEDGGYASGGWKSDDGKLSCGYSSFRGKRASMEDFYDIKATKIDGQSVCLFGIFDGHGGSRAAEFLKEHLFENLMKHPEFITNPKLAISDTYQQTDKDFLNSEKETFRDDGSTASTAVLVGNHLYVANVGDSRTIISKAGKAIPLSDDHKPNRSDERKRIESAGGVVMWAGTWRVGGVLAMSRAFGNRMLKQFVVAEPEIQVLIVLVMKTLTFHCNVLCWSFIDLPKLELEIIIDLTTEVSLVRCINKIYAIILSTVMDCHLGILGLKHKLYYFIATGPGG
ncbi:hypothetical protein ACS0TY_010524 [Phlomoides rotata]